MQVMSPSRSPWVGHLRVGYEQLGRAVSDSSRALCQLRDIEYLCQRLKMWLAVHIRCSSEWALIKTPGYIVELVSWLRPSFYERHPRKRSHSGWSQDGLRMILPSLELFSSTWWTPERRTAETQKESRSSRQLIWVGRVGMVLRRKSIDVNSDVPDQ